jgi:hypothetical protein
MHQILNEVWNKYKDNVFFMANLFVISWIVKCNLKLIQLFFINLGLMLYIKIAFDYKQCSTEGSQYEKNRFLCTKLKLFKI